MHKIAKKR